MSIFKLTTDKLSIGDPVMGLVDYAVSLPPGKYVLQAGALKPVDESLGPPISLDGPYLYVVDAAKADEFETAFHQLGSECAYDMMQMHSRHHEIEQAIGVHVAFYWEEELTGENAEGTYSLDLARIVRVKN